MPTRIDDCSLVAYIDGERLGSVSLDPIEIEPAAKPIGDLHSVPHYRCGVCYRAIVVFEGDEKPDKCQWCGVPVLWE